MGAQLTPLFGILFGSLGFGYVLYGRRNDAPVAFAAGLALIVAPYVVANPWWLALAGAGLAFVPYWLRD